ncbi:MAG: nucleotidyltransferase domain-containing protein [Betaproteobacteria bacterium]|nr:nucleotidyltransferase domain-containing protein [Betaproteobacteria bacterium]
MTQFGLSDKSLETVRDILSTCPEIEKALVYGSRAKGNYRTGSDIDITLVGAQLNMDMLFKLVRLFDESNLPYMVDLSIMANISNPNLLDHIERVGQLLYQRDNSSADLQKQIT